MSQLADYQNRYRFFHLERGDGGVLTVRFHTNGGPMAWGMEPLEELSYLWADIAADRSNHVVIVTGTGDGFIPTLAVAGDARMTPQVWDKIASDIRRTIGNHLSIEVPMIAAVNGPTLMHAEQALLCDVVIAADTAQFQDSVHFIAGMVPGDGTQVIYTHLMGANRARYFCFMGEKITARTALERGLISEIHESEQLLGRARQIAQLMLKQPELVRRYTRQALVEPIRRLYSQFLEHGLGLEGLGAWGGWPFEGGGVK
jgi:enoyl-CoA hydratase/carnithine racemase